MAKITLKNTQTIEDAFEDFIFYKNTQGVTVDIYWTAESTVNA